MRLACTLSLLAALAAGCASSTAPVKPVSRGSVVAVTATHQLIRFDAARPGQVLSSKPLVGLQPGETVLGIDYRVAKGWLYAVGSSNRLYRVNADTAIATPVGERFAVSLSGTHFGVDFNPTVDRIRVVSDTGQNLRLHPDTGAVVDGDATNTGVQTDGPLDYAPGDRSAGLRPALVAVGYTYNKVDDKLTTNYALDASAATLVTLGSREGVAPVVSPNTGHLFTVGPLGLPPFEDAAFDIADVSGLAFAAVTGPGATQSTWVEIDLATGAAREIGRIGSNTTVLAVAIEP
ncbi:DUF4394 domain-containing protein [Piscinibacter gummiphilus]|uniref:Uncharacterized protein n=1 Tax=Piscinibacter gummiphilus TaxID=946333 RepID=A0A1W6L5G4_9BURK|nr:DUF4394 domain-containing protein [Piscinibacter gummiphilus]ARN19494.1 hypothetical protein A4W93_05965 [Piscinibacter gummiphilus]ATU64164.1 DUF4394 domain-containing protein [Piscinibacter gummiphilus]GLS92863.1 hypothetical protein GCM10007918_01540 [Piscinibacter gummiphilus]